MKSATPLSPTTASKKVEFAYDYMHRRIQKKVFDWTGSAWSSSPSADTRFVYDQWNLLLELDGLNSNAVLRKYTWGLDLSGQTGSVGVSPAGLHAAGGIGGLLACADTATSAGYFYFYDANGNLGELIDRASGAVAADYDYDAYGNVLIANGTFAATNPFRFSTKYVIPETGHYDYGRRIYDPRCGRWTSRDPIEESRQINLFEFVYNQPIAIVDLDGRVPAAVAPAAAVIGLAAACMTPIFLDIQRQGPTVWSNDKYAHCLASCRISTLCGHLMSNLAGYSKELRDEISKRLGKDPDGWDPADIAANKDGRNCVGWAGWIPQFAWIRSTWAESCHCCCAKKHDPQPIPGPTTRPTCSECDGQHN